MKKRLFLGLLPAILALSACSGAGVKVEKNLYIEDTLAHEEVFDNAVLLPRRSLDPVYSSDIAIGVQYSAVADGKVSMRFIAAIKVDGANAEARKAALAHTTAVWTRSAYDASGNKLLTERDPEVPATKAYDEINSGGVELGIGDYGDHSYSFFVAYTMRNIPVATTSYLNVSLSVRDSENAAFNKDSKVVAASIDGSKKFSFDAASHDYFVTGNFGDVAQDAETKGENPLTDLGSFTFDVQENDTFLIVNKTASKFVVYDATRLRGDTSNFAFSNADGMIKANLDESVVLYLNSEGLIYSSLSGEHYQLFIADVLSPISSAIIAGYETDKAVFSGVVIENNNTSVKVKCNGSQVGATYNISYAGSYTIGLNAGDQVFANGNDVVVNITVDCTNKGDVAGWGGRVYIVGEFCNWDSRNANAIALTQTSTKIWTGTITWKYGTTYSVKVRLNTEEGVQWESNSDNWYPSSNYDFVPYTGHTALNLTWN